MIPPAIEPRVLMLHGTMTIPAVGPITALTWVLEVGDVKRFSSIKKAISYCGLCGAEKSSADTVKRTPISKQRNKHLQSVLVEAAKMAPRLSSELALIYDREKQKGNANRATLAVARKLVAYLVAIDRSQRDFLVVEKENCAAAENCRGKEQKSLFDTRPARSCCCRLGDGAQALDTPVELFQDWQEITNSIFCGGRWWPRQQMDVWFCISQERSPRGITASRRT